MNKTFLSGIAKLAFVYIPLAFVVLVAYYFAGNALSAHDLSWLAAVAGGAAVGLLFWLFNILLGPTMLKLKMERKSRVNGDQR